LYVPQKPAREGIDAHCGKKRRVAQAYASGETAGDLDWGERFVMNALADTERLALGPPLEHDAGRVRRYGRL
jgi:hypothetical protein